MKKNFVESRLFKQRMNDYGLEKLRRDVEILRNLRNRTFYECGMQTVSKNDPKADPRFKPWHDDVNGFMPSKEKLTNSTCVFLGMAENPFTEFLQQRHLVEVSKSKPKLIKSQKKTSFVPPFSAGGKAKKLLNEEKKNLLVKEQTGIANQQKKSGSNPSNESRKFVKDQWRNALGQPLNQRNSTNENFMNRSDVNSNGIGRK